MDISIIKNAVDDKFIQSKIDVGESQELEEATIGGESNTSNNIRSTNISWIMDKTILLTLKDKMFEINKSKNWNYNLTDMFLRKALWLMHQFLQQIIAFFLHFQKSD